MDWIRDNRRVLIVGGVLAIISLAYWPVIKSLLGLIVGGAALAFVLYPFVKQLSRKMKRSAAIFTAFGCVAALFIGVVVMLVPIFVNQVQSLIKTLPMLSESINGFMQRLNTFISDISARFPEGAAGAMQGSNITAQFTEKLGKLPEQIAGALGGMLSGTASVASGIADGIGRFSLMIILCYYFLKDRERMMLQLELLLPQRIRVRVLKTCGDIQMELGGYVRGQLLISLIVGAITAAGLAILGVPSFLVLGLIMAVFNLIPYFGALLGAVPIVLLTLSMGWFKVLEVVIMLFAAQQIENMVIAPRVTGKTTGMHPVAVILALTAGGMLGGVAGMVFAIPGAIVIRGIAREVGRSGAIAADALPHQRDSDEN